MEMVEVVDLHFDLMKLRVVAVADLYFASKRSLEMAGARQCGSKELVVVLDAPLGAQSMVMRLTSQDQIALEFDHLEELRSLHLFVLAARVDHASYLPASHARQPKDDLVEYLEPMNSQAQRIPQILAMQQHHELHRNFRKPLLPILVQAFQEEWGIFVKVLQHLRIEIAEAVQDQRQHVVVYCAVSLVE